MAPSRITKANGLWSLLGIGAACGLAAALLAPSASAQTYYGNGRVVDGAPTTGLDGPPVVYRNPRYEQNADNTPTVTYGPPTPTYCDNSGCYDDSPNQAVQAAPGQPFRGGGLTPNEPSVTLSAERSHGP